MKLHFSPRYLIVTAILTTALAGRAPAQPNQANDSPAPSAPSAGVADVLKMLDAGVSKDVIKTYIETSPASFSAGASDLITLKNHGVNDEITMAILKHGPTATTVVANVPTTSTSADNSSAPVHTYIINNRIDPDSYEFFQHYYLMPRTLAYVNQTLGYPAVPYGDGFAPYYPSVYGYGTATGFGGYSGFAGRRSIAFGRGVAGFRAR